MFDYKSSKEWPFFDVNFTLFPSKEQQVTPGARLPIADMSLSLS